MRISPTTVVKGTDLCIESLNGVVSFKFMVYGNWIFWLLFYLRVTEIFGNHRFLEKFKFNFLCPKKLKNHFDYCKIL